MIESMKASQPAVVNRIASKKPATGKRREVMAMKRSVCTRKKGISAAFLRRCRRLGEAMLDVAEERLGGEHGLKSRTKRVEYEKNEA